MRMLHQFWANMARKSVRRIDRIDASPLVTVEFAGRAHHQAARAWLPDQRISYTDAVSFAVMEAARCATALSFDQDFTLAGFRLWQHGE